MVADAAIPKTDAASGSLRRLYRAVERARGGMKDFREQRRADNVRIAGPGFRNADAAEREQAGVNMMRFALYVYTRMFTPRSPQALIITRADALKRSAAELQLALNATAEGMKLARVIEQCVMQAMTSIGVIRVGITHSPNYAIPDYRGDGYPYACCIDFDDFVFDLYAHKWEECEFYGNFYRMPLEDLRGNDDYDQAVVRRLQPSERRTHLEDGTERNDTISRGEESATDELYDYVDLVDLYVPRTKMFYTCSADFHENLKPLRQARWQGPPEGPYHLLWFYDLDGQLMPLPPSAMWRDMSDLIENLFTKMANQALRQKQVGLADVTNVPDAEKIRDAKDGEIVPVRNPSAVAQQSYGGVDNNTHAFTLGCMTLFNRLNWNIEVVAGIGPQSNTLGQDEMISAAANKQLQNMQERVLELTAGVLRAIGWAILTDPLVNVPIVKTLDGYPEVRVESAYTPESQAGSILDYRVEVHPYSWKITTPAGRLAALNNFIQGIAMPLGQMMAQQGIVIDWKKFVDLWSQYAQLPELKDVVITSPAGPMDPADNPLPKPAASKRVYERRNVSDRSPDADREQLMQQLMSSGGGQGSRAA